MVIDNRAAIPNLYKVVGEIDIDDRQVYLHQTPIFHGASFPGVLGIPATGGTSTIIGMSTPDRFVVGAAECEVTADDLESWCRDRIAAYKVPKSWSIRSEPLPLSGALKVLKRELREPVWEGHDRSVG